MPDAAKPQIGPMTALTAIRKLAEVALDTGKPELYEKTLREILQGCDNALPSKRKGGKTKAE